MFNTKITCQDLKPHHKNGDSWLASKEYACKKVTMAIYFPVCSVNMQFIRNFSLENSEPAAFSAKSLADFIISVTSLYRANHNLDYCFLTRQHLFYDFLQWLKIITEMCFNISRKKQLPWHDYRHNPLPWSVSFTMFAHYSFQLPGVACFKNYRIC